MKQLNEELTEKFLEDLVDRSVRRLESALETLDISLDYVAALLSGESAVQMQLRQKEMGRTGAGPTAIRVAQQGAEE